VKETLRLVGDQEGRVSDAQLAILIVDDREENLIALEAVLEPLGQRVVRARSGEDALRKLLAEEFAVILLDVHMPGIDGIETARLIKSRGRSRPTPILFVTASSTGRNMWPGYETGAVDFLMKPFDPDVLRAKVAVFVELARSRDEIRRAAEDRIERARTEAARAAAEAHAAEADQLRLELVAQSAALAERTDEAEQLAEELALANSRLRRAAEAAESLDTALRQSEARARAAVAAAEASADRAQRLQAVASALSEAATAEAVARVIVVHGMTATGADAGSLTAVHYDESGAPAELETLEVAGVEGELAREFQHFPVVAGRPLSDAALGGAPVFVGSLREWRERYPAMAPAMSRTGHEGYAAIPVAVGGRVAATLSFTFREARAFDDGLRSFLVTLGSLCAQALARAELYEAERRARADAEGARAQVTGLVESVRDAFVGYDRDFRFTFVNHRAAELFRLSGVGGELTGRVLWDAFPALAGTEAERQMRRAMEERVPTGYEVRSAELGRSFSVRVYPAADGGISAYWVDVTEERRAAEATALLAAASEALVASLDVEQTLAGVARLVVRSFADYCAVHLVCPDGSLRLVEVAHADPARAAVARQIEARYPFAPDAPVGAPAAVRSGRSALQSDLPPERLAAAARDPEHLALLRALGVRSTIVVPLIARGRTLGALTFAAAESGRRFTTTDLATAEELARRAALAVDNARLYTEAEAARRAAEQAAREAEVARLGAEEASRAKSEFLATMSHELRTPLNSVLGHGELLELGLHGPLTPAQREALTRVRRSARQLLSLINDVLNLSRLESGTIEYHAEPVALDPLLREVEALLAPHLEAKPLRYSYAGCGPEVRALADEDKVRQIILNLLSNAVKFTDAGGAVGVTCEASEGGTVAVRVTDSGRGVPPEKLESIFEPFVQAHRSLSEPVEGSGLGLAISRQLARAMRGDVTVESEPGRGSTFMLTLPRA